jgi:hypothetical protein
LVLVRKDLTKKEIRILKSKDFHHLGTS